MFDYYIHLTLPSFTIVLQGQKVEKIEEKNAMCCCDVMIVLLCTIQWSKTFTKILCTIQMIQNIYKQKKIQSCRKYFSKGLRLFPKQFITSPRYKLETKTIKIDEQKTWEGKKKKWKETKKGGKKLIRKKTWVVNSQQLPTLARGNQGG